MYPLLWVNFYPRQVIGGKARNRDGEGKALSETSPSADRATYTGELLEWSTAHFWVFTRRESFGQTPAVVADDWLCIPKSVCRLGTLQSNSRDPGERCVEESSKQPPSMSASVYKAIDDFC